MLGSFTIEVVYDDTNFDAIFCEAIEIDSAALEDEPGRVHRPLASTRPSDEAPTASPGARGQVDAYIRCRQLPRGSCPHTPPSHSRWCRPLRRRYRAR